MYRIEPVSFLSQGERVVGRLFLAETDRPTSTYVVMGPVSSVKEQSPLQYATRLAASGAVALTFDPRCFGESEGEPRQFDDPQRKVADLRAAADFLLARPGVDPTTLTMLGICMGCNWAAQAVADDDRFRRAIFVAGSYSIRSRRLEAAGGEEVFDKQLAIYRDAVERFEHDGTIDFHTLVADRMEDSYFSWAVPFHWYGMWTDPGPLTYKGGWQNRLATISDYGHYAFDVAEAFERITVPTLVFNSTASATPLDTVRSLMGTLPPAESELVATGNQLQTQFYDDPATIDLVVARIVDQPKPGRK